MNFFIIDKKELIEKINTNSFKYIISIIIIFFSLVIYLSLPSFYNYESFDNNLKRKLAKEFKLNFENLNGIKYSFFPRPHFIVEKASLGFLNKDSEIAELNKFKIHLSIKNLNRLDRIKITKLIINKANFNVTFKELGDFIDHMNLNIHKPISIRNSNFFLKNETDDILSISKNKKFEYFINEKNKEKNLKIIGKLFGINVKYNWTKSYLNFNEKKSKITFDNPNIEISSFFQKNIDDGSTIVNSKITFLSNAIDLNYKFDKNSVEFFDIINQQNKKLRNKINLVGYIDLKPFFFDLKVYLANLKLENILQVIFFNLNRLDNQIHTNFNGNIRLNLKNLNNRLFENLNFDIVFSEGEIFFKDTKIDFKNIGTIYFNNVETLERDEKLYLLASLKIEINDKKQFFQRFQIPKKNRSLKENLYINLEINLDENKYYLSNIYFKDERSKELIDLEYYEVKNFQKLTVIVRDEFSKIKKD